MMTDCQKRFADKNGSIERNFIYVVNNYIEKLILKKLAVFIAHTKIESIAWADPNYFDTINILQGRCTIELTAQKGNFMTHLYNSLEDFMHVDFSTTAKWVFDILPIYK